MRLERWGLVLVVLLGAMGLASAQALPPPLVDAAWLTSNLGSNTLCLVDTRDDIRDYWRGHIPGAQWVSPEALRWPEAGTPGKFIGRNAMRLMMAALGIRDDTTVVVYADATDFRATYFAWALDYMGHRRFTILDGGFKQWVAAQGKVDRAYPKVSASLRSRLTTAVDESLRVSLEQVRQRLQEPGTVLLDVRSHVLYTGEQGFWPRNGHIPGALNLPWESTVAADGRLKPAAELKAAYEAIGATPDKRVITSCGLGQQGSHTWFVLKHVLNYPEVANFDGSFSEWTDREDLPVATGDSPG